MTALDRRVAPVVGDRVRVERDETRYPSKGTWPQFRGRTGTVVEINEDRKHPHLTEYGVSFGKFTKAPTSHRREFNWSAADVVWFKLYEIAPLASMRHVQPCSTVGTSGGSREVA